MLARLISPGRARDQGPELRDRRDDGYGPLAAFPGPLLRVRAALPYLRRRAAFLYPWAVIYRDLGLYSGFVEMAMLILGVGLAYAWKKGPLKWV